MPILQLTRSGTKKQKKIVFGEDFNLFLEVKLEVQGGTEEKIFSKTNI